jgi:hypothetical protein
MSGENRETAALGLGGEGSRERGLAYPCLAPQEQQCPAPFQRYINAVPEGT